MASLPSAETSYFRLWLHGKPGTGKSTLAAYLVEQVHARRTSDEIVLHFFCDGRDTGKRTTTSILKALIAQVLESTDRRLYPEDFRIIQEDMLKKPESYPYSVKDLEKHLLAVLKSFTKISYVLQHFFNIRYTDQETFIA